MLINDFECFSLFFRLIFDIHTLRTHCAHYVMSKCRQKLCQAKALVSVDLISSIGSILIRNYNIKFLLIVLDWKAHVKRGHLINRIKIRTVERVSVDTSPGGIGGRK